jgi:hypothetical protein
MPNAVAGYSHRSVRTLVTPIRRAGNAQIRLSFKGLSDAGNPGWAMLGMAVFVIYVTKNRY